MASLELLKEVWMLMKVRKRYWLLPLFLIFALFGILLVFSETSAVAPFIYTLF